MRDKYNIIPLFLAGLFHVLIIGGLVVAIDFSKPAYPAVPLAIRATLVTLEDLPEPEPAAEPAPPPETAEQIRVRAEEQKRQADMREEQERIRLQDEADSQRRKQEEAERKRLREEEVERRRQEAERKRLEDMERQRLENLRQRQEAEAAQIARSRQAELDAEDMRLAALSADDKTRWAAAVRRAITQNFIRPASAPAILECDVNVRQLPGGRVVSVEIGQCNGDAAVRRALEAAVYKASPLPSPDNPIIFERDLIIEVNIEE